MGRIDNKDFLDGKYRRKDPWGYQEHPQRIWTGRTNVEGVSMKGKGWVSGKDLSPGESPGEKTYRHKENKPRKKRLTLEQELAIYNDETAGRQGFPRR